MSGMVSNVCQRRDEAYVIGLRSEQEDGKAAVRNVLELAPFE